MTIRTRAVVDRYVAALADEPALLSGIVAAEAELETNLGRAEDFLEQARRLSALAEVRVAHRVDAEDGAVVVYDCVARDGRGAVRVIDYLAVADGRVSGVRRVYDVVAVGRVLPGLAAGPHRGG